MKCVISDVYQSFVSYKINITSKPYAQIIDTIQLKFMDHIYYYIRNEVLNEHSID